MNPKLEKSGVSNQKEYIKRLPPFAVLGPLILCAVGLMTIWGRGNYVRQQSARREFNSPEKFEAMKMLLHVSIMTDDGKSILQIVRNLPMAEARKERPVQTASANRKSHVLKALLDVGFDPDGESSQGGPIRIAAASGYDDIVTLLILHGAEVDLTQEGARTALCQAATFGQLGCAKLLIEHGADVNYSLSDTDPQEAEWTPLHLAAANGHIDIVRCLLAHGAKSLKSTAGLTPLELSKNLGKTEVVKLLSTSLALDKPHVK